jgi:hypothetical protein
VLFTKCDMFKPKTLRCGGIKNARKILSGNLKVNNLDLSRKKILKYARYYKDFKVTNIC